MTDFAQTRAAFDLPEGVAYLNGNSLGPLPKGARARADQVIAQEWGQMLIRAWNAAGWMGLPRRVGDKIGRLIGAPPGSVTVGDTLSIKVFQALDAALRLRPGRSIALSDSGNFPTDLYMAQGLIKRLGGGATLRVVAPEDVAGALNDDVAVLMLTEVDYRTGRLHDMAGLTRKAHDVGALTVWDLAHSAGAIPVDVRGCGADFAVGCTYKYLNGGPGAPAFIYAAEALADQVDPVLSGWLGHEAPFAFDLDYRPAPGVERLRVGTPSVVQLSMLDAALDVWDGVDMADVRAQSIALSERFIAAVEGACPDLRLVSPRNPDQRGSQVSFVFEHGYAAMQALISQGVIGDFRAPDVMRFGFAPLYMSEGDVDRAAACLAQILRDKTYLAPEFQTRAAVT